jgi:hypothetical protein
VAERAGRGLIGVFGGLNETRECRLCKMTDDISAAAHVCIIEKEGEAWGSGNKLKRAETQRLVLIPDRKNNCLVIRRDHERAYT